MEEAEEWMGGMAGAPRGASIRPAEMKEEGEKRERKRGEASEGRREEKSNMVLIGRRRRIGVRRGQR
jgi:hypothetical protein